MYVKIVRLLYDEKGVPATVPGYDAKKIVPKESYLLECRDVTYRKIAVDTDKELDAYFQYWGYLEVLGERRKKMKDFTFLHLTLSGCKGLDLPDSDLSRAVETKRRIILLEGTVFIMNDEGKTIDKISCN